MKKIILIILTIILLTGCSSSNYYYMDDSVIEDYEWQISNLYEKIDNLEDSIEERDSFLEYAENYLNETRYVTQDNFYHKYECCDLYKKKFNAIILKDAISQYKECPNCIRADYTKYYDYPGYYDSTAEETELIQLGDFYAYITSFENAKVNSIVFNCNSNNYFHKLNCPLLVEPINQMSIEMANEKEFIACFECMN